MFLEIKDFKFMEKYLVYGPTLLYQRNLKEEDNELFSKMIELDSLRNRIVHEGTSSGYRILQDKNYNEIYSYIEDMIDDVEDVISWVNALV